MLLYLVCVMGSDPVMKTCNAFAYSSPLPNEAACYEARDRTSAAGLESMARATLAAATEHLAAFGELPVSATTNTYCRGDDEPPPGRGA